MDSIPVQPPLPCAETLSCWACKRTLPLECFSFRKKASGKRQDRCKECCNVYSAARYAAKRDELLTQMTASRNANIEEYRARRRESYAANPLKKQQAAAAQKRWNDLHPGEACARALIWRAEHPELKKSTDAVWRKQNPGRKRANDLRRSGRLVAAGPYYTGAEWESLKAQYDFRCLMCGRKEPEISLTFDHIVPVSKGGANDIDNGQPLCGPCNARKGSKTIDLR